MRSFPFKYPLKNIFLYRIDFSDYHTIMSSLTLRRSLRFVRQPLLSFRGWLSDSSLTSLFHRTLSPARYNKTLSMAFDGKLKMGKILTVLTVSY